MVKRVLTPPFLPRLLWNRQLARVLLIFALLGSGPCQQFASLQTTTQPASGGSVTASATSHVQKATSIQRAPKQLQASALSRSGLTSWQCPELRDLPTQGISCLHCTHPKAQKQADLLTSLLLAACLKNIAITYLVDGSFGTLQSSESFLRSQLEKLASGGRTLSLYLYLANGPLQRRLARNGVSGDQPYFSRLNPSDFRTQIFTDPQLQFEYQTYVRTFLPLLRYADALKIRIFIIPYLEDNLNLQAFEQLVQLSIDALGNEIPISYGRSACPRCFSGNDGAIPRGIWRDVHTSLTRDIRTFSGLVSNDGDPFDFDNASPGLTLDQLQTVRTAALRKRNTFILWTAQFQGLPVKDGEIAAHPNPDQRGYQIPTQEQAQEIIQFFQSAENN